MRIAAATNSADAQRRWSHGIIERQVQHMSQLLDDLLDVSRVGRGTLLLRKSNEVLSVVMDTALEAARPRIEAKRHRFNSGRQRWTPSTVLQNCSASRDSKYMSPTMARVGQERDRRLALEAGCDDHVTKPMPLDVVCRLLQQVRNGAIH